MLAGFNVLLTGLGSKFHLLEEFRRVALQGERCGTVMGFKSSCSLGELAEMLCGRAFGVNTDGMRVDGMVGLGATCDVGGGGASLREWGVEASVLGGPQSGRTGSSGAATGGVSEVGLGVLGDA